MPAARLVIQKKCSVMTGSWRGRSRRRPNTCRSVRVDSVDGVDSVEVVASVVVACAAVVVSAPVDPSHATAPQNRTKDARMEANTRWRITVTRRARAARSSWAEGMPLKIAPASESRLRGA